MPHVTLKEVLTRARQGNYGVLSLLGADMQMALGLVQGAEDKRAPLILVYNQEVTPQIPMEVGIPLLVNLAERSSVPVATILDHGRNLEDVVRAIRLGASSVMFDGSILSIEENVAQTREVVRVAHAVGVSVEAELGSIAGNAVSLDESGPESAFTDPDVAADFVAQTDVDTLAVSFGNTHGLYRGEPQIDLDRVRQIHAKVKIPLAMHGASGLAYDMYPKVVQSGISKICYYTAMAIKATDEIRTLLMDTEHGPTVYHHVIGRALDSFYAETKHLIDLAGCAGVV
jgi:fructose-bisphosphate aldolase class II